ncbi:hypothetical protein [Haloferula sp. BvORR071]|uniref:hypothetical protein n=1 Tax=Haloferula sp. BvORR071 TaxID=1396141 RepID=UPI0005568732|nr:hypothetical protein [Haloferula sp. BvORR071]
MDDYDRREFLSMGLPSFLGVMMALPSLCSLATRANAQDGRLPEDGAMHWEAFLEAVAKEAAKQHLDAWNQEDYVASIGKLARRLHMEDPVMSKAMEQLDARLKQGDVDFQYLETRVDFSLCLVQFDVGQVIKPHDHPGMTGMILCASGEIETANYDLIEKPEGEELKAGHCLLRHVGQTVLQKNDLSTLTAKARNIHTLTARKVTQLVDIFTPPYNEQRNHDSRWFELDGKPREGSKDLFEAKIV